MGYFEKTTQHGLKQHIVKKELSKSYTIEEFVSMRKQLSTIRLGASWGKLFKNKMIKSYDFMFEEGHFEDTIFNIEIQKFASSIFIDRSVWYRYNKSNPKSTMNMMSTDNYIVGQYYVLSRYKQFLDYLLIQNRIDVKSRDEYINSYTSDIMYRIDEKINK